MPLTGHSRAGAGSRTSVAYESLRQSIFTNQFKPGDYLSENHLAQSLGMSRTPIREAIRVLANEGLIEVHNGVGIFVKQITAKEISDLFAVRAALECAALPSALELISNAEIDAIYQKWLEQKKRIDLGERVDLDYISELDYQLHFLIVDRCSNEFLKQVMSGIRIKIKRYQRMSATLLDDENDQIGQHLEILNYMRRRDLDPLAKVLREHIRRAAENITNNPSWRI
jgi:GntR family transcriptional regulator, rspAB operon transcriptional repressor